MAKNEKVRVTQHCGREGSGDHNDRSFLDEAERVPDNIDEGMLDENGLTDWLGLYDESVQEVPGEFVGKMTVDGNDTWYVTVGGEERPIGRFRDAEKAFYDLRYSDALQERNETYRRNRHPERCKTMDDWLTGSKTRPEEVILQIGNADNEIDHDTFCNCVEEYITEMAKWSKETGGHLHILDAATHFDEASPHVHIRRIWDYEKDGIFYIGQEKALIQSGVSLPDPDEPEGRHNNRKMAFDAMMREKWIAICKGHGYDVEEEPAPKRNHMKTKDYIRMQRREYQAKMDALGVMEKKLDFREGLLDKREAELDKRKASLNASEKRCEAREALLREKGEELAIREEKALERENRASETIEVANGAWAAFIEASKDATAYRDALEARLGKEKVSGAAAREAERMKRSSETAGVSHGQLSKAEQIFLRQAEKVGKVSGSADRVARSAELLQQDDGLQSGHSGL